MGEVFPSHSGPAKCVNTLPFMNPPLMTELRDGGREGGKVMISWKGSLLLLPSHAVRRSVPTPLSLQDKWEIPQGDLPELSPGVSARKTWV